MKTTLIIPTPEVSNARPTLDRTTLIVELDIDRAIAGGAFAGARNGSREPADGTGASQAINRHSWRSIN